MNWIEALITPQAGYLRELARETDTARKEYNLALANYRRFLEEEGKTSYSKALDEMAKRGVLTPSAAAKVQAQLQSQQMQELGNAYAEIEMARAAARARAEQLRNMAKYVGTQEAIQFGKELLGAGLSVAGAVASGGTLAGPIMAGIGAGLSGLDLTNLALQRHLQAQQTKTPSATTKSTYPQFERLTPQQLQGMVAEKPYNIPQDKASLLQTPDFSDTLARYYTTGVLPEVVTTAPRAIMPYARYNSPYDYRRRLSMTEIPYY